MAVSSWDNGDQAAAAEALVMTGAARCSVGRSTSAKSSLRRCIKFAQAASLPVGNLTAAHSAQFLRGVAGGGPTAASAVYPAFKWCDRNLGGDFPFEHFLTLPYKGHQQVRVAKQAPELQPWELLNILAVTRELFALMAAASCVRS